MAIPIARVHLAMAHAVLPALLPTPPKIKMLPLLPTPPCVVVVLPVSPPKPSRADAEERWDARKARPASPASSVSSQRSMGSIRSSPARASSSDKRSSPPPSSSGDHPSSRVSSSAAHREGNRRAISRAASSSAERWDAHKKPRPPAEELDGGASSATGSNDLEVDMPRPQRAQIYAGPGFLVASPEPSMLPMPSSFMVRVAA